jgi:hypothetical protein
MISGTMASPVVDARRDLTGEGPFPASERDGGSQINQVGR